MSRGKSSFFDDAGRDWDTAWKMKLTPWDLRGAVYPALIQAIEEHQIVPLKKDDQTQKSALIPGCGTGSECIYLKSVGFTSVVGLDISPTAVEIARKQLQGQMNGVDFQVQDFFQYNPPNYRGVHFIFDYLLFSAIDPSMRAMWASAMRRNLLPNEGVLATLIFPLRTGQDDSTKGPPYAVNVEDYKKVLKPGEWELFRLETEIKSIKPRAKREIMAYWRRTQSPGLTK